MQLWALSGPGLVNLSHFLLFNGHIYMVRRLPEPGRLAFRPISL